MCNRLKVSDDYAFGVAPTSPHGGKGGATCSRSPLTRSIR